MARQKILFMDWRDIQCGHLRWRTEDGTRLGVGNPPEPPEPLHSEAHRVPHGIRLAAQPAETTGPVDGWKGWGRTIHDGGRYRSWHFEVNGFTKLGSGAAALHLSSDGRLHMCWGAYDIQECSNDGIVLYSVSPDQGENWESPQVFMASPNAVVSHLQFAELGNSEALMVYREGHYYGAREDRRHKATLGWANYAESPMHLLQKRSRDNGYTWEPPTEIEGAAPDRQTADPSGRFVIY